MQNLSSLSTLMLFFVFVGSLLASPAYSQSQTLKYSYDELGRLTVVEDSQNGNRTYAYDPAGNRTGVNLPPSPPPVATLAAPKGLKCYENWGPGAWKGQWDAVSGAHYYVFKAVNKSEISVSGTSTGSTPIQQSTKPCSWVKACDANNNCGPQAYF